MKRGAVLVAHESEAIREVIRRLLEDAGFGVSTAADGRAAVAALRPAPDALVLDVALSGVHSYELVQEARRCAPSSRIILVASVYNRTGYKRRPTSLYGADDYVEQHHIPDKLVEKISALIGPPGELPHPPAPHEDTDEARAIRAAAELRLVGALEPLLPSQAVQRAERLARLIVADIALYNGDALDAAERLGNTVELEARLRLDLEEGRLIFDLRVPAEVRRTRDFIGEALDELRATRRAAAGGQ
jgi:CheY-like chemotaxis protein